jgi:hypothetical protein
LASKLKTFNTAKCFAECHKLAHYAEGHYTEWRVASKDTAFIFFKMMKAYCSLVQGVTEALRAGFNRN